MKKIRGLISATYTPFDKNGNLNSKIIPAYADYLKKSGVSGVFVNGTTGEGLSLSVKERMNSAEIWTDQKSKNFKVLIHVGHNSLKEAARLAKHSAKIGADGIGSMAPVFFKPNSLVELVNYNATIAQSAKKLPYYYYHIPSMTGAHFQMIDFLALAERKIPNLGGIKFTSEDLMDLKLCVEYKNRKYSFFHGRDEILICGLTLGVEGAIGSTYNYMAPLFVKIIKAFKKGDLKLGNELQYKAIKIIQVLIKFGGGVRAGKSFMRLVGFDFGQPRLPVVGLTKTEEKALAKELKAVGFFFKKNMKKKLPNSTLK